MKIFRHFEFSQAKILGNHSNPVNIVYTSEKTFLTRVDEKGTRLVRKVNTCCTNAVLHVECLASDASTHAAYLRKRRFHTLAPAPAHLLSPLASVRLTSIVYHDVTRRTPS
ncbi:hypothetical protein M378DRAFT_763635 [Amanita muscaria Koide BX008]|uniref:Uncharacterized protein n=1 Tax=Amanita muscaria (strain Koide BX008) TaxID=946122 RepID=A0A0C2SZV7_AMAMK|nr:hypothetical protein M378DRAFT_763635 [Amanita muscaria Koide BX008]